MNGYYAGIKIRNGDNNVITDNKLENYTDGLSLDHSSYNVVARNSLIGQGVIESTRSGIRLDVGTGNIVSENNVSNFYFGINEQESNDLIYNNNVTNNYYAVWLGGEAYINRFYRNNIMNNTRTVLTQAYFGINLNYWDNGFEGNYWSNFFFGVDSNGDGISETPYAVSVNNTDNYPLVKPLIVETIPPQAILLSPENKIYTTTDLQLTFTVDESASWKAYSLDGRGNVTISGNTTISGLSIGTHNVTVTVRDLSGNIASSDTIQFTVNNIIPEFSQNIALIILLLAILPIILYAKSKVFVEKSPSPQLPRE